MLFAGVCTLNCLFLYAWEHPLDHSRAHVTTRWALRHLMMLSTVLIALSMAFSLIAAVPWIARTPVLRLGSLHHPAMVPLACALSLALLLVLHIERYRFAALQLRALADLVLLTPLLLLSLAWLVSLR